MALPKQVYFGRNKTISTEYSVSADFRFFEMVTFGFRCFGKNLFRSNTSGLALTVAKTAPMTMTANMESFILSPTGENFPSSVKTLGPRRRVLDMHYLWS